MWRPVRALPNSGLMGTNYLLAFDEPVGHARHYRGWSAQVRPRWKLGMRHDDPRLTGRLRDHARGVRGANLVQVARAKGIGWTLVWYAPGDRNEERRKKNCGAYSRRDCCLCAAGIPHGKDTTDV
jgi:hypothetical protein